MPIARCCPKSKCRHSKMKESIAHILKREGYIAESRSRARPLKKIKLKLKYQGRKGVIEGLRRVSTPGLRRYVGCDRNSARSRWPGRGDRFDPARRDDAATGPQEKSRRRIALLRLVRF